MKETILLVDDEQGIRNVLGISLADIGYEVFTAADGREAFETFCRMKPSIVVTDIKMPGMDGVELLKRIKQEDADTEVIMITGHGDLDLAIESLKNDAADFVTKPINGEVLELALGRVVEKLGMKRELKRYTENLEELVREKSARLRQLFDEVPCYITVQDKNFAITEMNRHFQEDFGGSPGELCYKLYKHRDRVCDNCPVAKTFEDGESHQTEEVVTALNGEQYIVLISTAPIRNSDGEIVQVMEMSTNITQIRQLQDRLTNLGLMLGSISHGVKGLLTAMDGGVYRLKSAMAKQDWDRVGSATESLEGTAGRISRLVLDILYYAKSRELHSERLEVSLLAESVADAVEPRAVKAGVKFVREFEEPLGCFDVDAGALDPAMVNFLENAVDACESDNSKEDHEVFFGVRVQGGEVVFEIRDNGMGMNQETREKMFTLFFSSKGKKGTGLGMFIANRAVEQHGGSIDVESEPGKGTNILVRLPVKQSASCMSGGNCAAQDELVKGL